MACKSCEVLYVNGVLTHERGCPDAWKDYTRECKWCGTKFKPEEKHQGCCSHSCDVAYNNLDCGCAECKADEVQEVS